jgi:hypothetical protein
MLARRATTVLIIGRLEYVLSPFEDVEALKRTLLDAARAGSDLVNFRANGDVEVHVLVMPGVTVVLEERDVETDHSLDPAPGDHDAGPIGDFDMF